MHDDIKSHVAIAILLSSLSESYEKGRSGYAARLTKSADVIATDFALINKEN